MAVEKAQAEQEKDMLAKKLEDKQREWDEERNGLNATIKAHVEQGQQDEGIKAELRSQVQHLDSSVAALHSTVADRNRTITYLISTLASRNSILTKRKRTVTNRNRTIINLNSTLADRNSTITNLNSTLADHNSTITTLNSTITTLESTAADQNGTITTQNSTITTLESTAADQQTKLNDAVEEIARLKQVIATQVPRYRVVDALDYRGDEDCMSEVSAAPVEREPLDEIDAADPVVQADVQWLSEVDEVAQAIDNVLIAEAQPEAEDLPTDQIPSGSVVPAVVEDPTVASEVADEESDEAVLAQLNSLAPEGFPPMDLDAMDLDEDRSMEKPANPAEQPEAGERAVGEAKDVGEDVEANQEMGEATPLDPNLDHAEVEGNTGCVLPASTSAVAQLQQQTIPGPYDQPSTTPAFTPITPSPLRHGENVVEIPHWSAPFRPYNRELTLGTPPSVTQAGSSPSQRSAAPLYNPRPAMTRAPQAPSQPVSGFSMGMSAIERYNGPSARRAPPGPTELPTLRQRPS